jgi:hypothetical protein
VYAGWCGDDEDAPVFDPAPVTPYSTYAANLPANAQSAAWPKVNYVLNNKSGTAEEVQTAIWILLNGSTNRDITPNVTAMVNAANANPSFVPSGTQVLAVLLYIDGFAQLGGPVQDTIIELPVCSTTGPTGCMTLTKASNAGMVPAGSAVTYTYTVLNGGAVTLTNIVVKDDNATPGYAADDFTVGTVASLAPGMSATLTSTRIPPVILCAAPGTLPSGPLATLITEKLANGDVKVTFRQSTAVNDNTYGTQVAPDWGRSHSFGDLTGRRTSFSRTQAGR